MCVRGTYRLLVPTKNIEIFYTVGIVFSCFSFLLNIFVYVRKAKILSSYVLFNIYNSVIFHTSKFDQKYCSLKFQTKLS